MAFAALTIVASAGNGGRLAEADRLLFEVIRAQRGRARTTAARIISAFGEPVVVYPVLVVGGVMSRKDGWPRAFVPCLVVASGAVARRRLSRVIARPRPSAGAWLTRPEGYSLPSKHTTLAALAACARRETLEETGRAVEPARIAFVLESQGPRSGVHTVDLVFLATPEVRGQEPRSLEPDLSARFVSLDQLHRVNLRPPKPIDSSTSPTKISQMITVSTRSVRSEAIAR